MASTDLAAVQARYQLEAQKRLRPEGLAQFAELSTSDSERLRHLVDDIWADHAALDASPSPIGPDGSTKFLIVGAGIAGIMSAIRLIKQGFTADQMVLVESAGGFGGTWYWNRYPGLHCDVESYIYMPLLEETGFVPSKKYAPGVEIRKYLGSLAQRYNLQSRALFRTTVSHMQWDEASGAWKVDLKTGKGPRGQDVTESTVKAEFPLLTAGLLSKPKVPKLGGVGIEGFQGDVVHTAMWNYDATGGSPEEPFPELSKLKGKKVGIIGTGATAIQAAPELAKYAGELYVFQRTPSAVYTRGQRATDPEEWRTQIAAKPGWQEERLVNFTAAVSNRLGPGEKNLVDDEWSKQPAYGAIIGEPKYAHITPDMIPEVIGHYLAADAENSARLRRRTAEIVRDQDTAAKLTPWYPAWCKRPCHSDAYLESFNEPHVHLVDTDGRGVDGVTAGGLVADGREFPLDVLVLATGFVAPDLDPMKRSSCDIVGRRPSQGDDGGQEQEQEQKPPPTLTQKWAPRGPETLHGVATSGFPNLFFYGPLQAGAAANHYHTLESQIRHFAYIAGAAHRRVGGLDRQRVRVEVEPAAEQAWALRIAQGAARYAVMSVCTPSYVNAEGHAMDPHASPEEMFKGAKRATWSAGLIDYCEVIKKWEDEGGLEGLSVSCG
ncbi:FAD/NAD(P)-binding domain-containing protein [Xylariomycetidae sp. FL2044]|nr:FAD/NAD(P)-binding domain-containing protein [Xylariomycetidae sp. FL2044]